MVPRTSESSHLESRETWGTRQPEYVCYSRSNIPGGRPARSAQPLDPEHRFPIVLERRKKFPLCDSLEEHQVPEHELFKNS